MHWLISTLAIVLALLALGRARALSRQLARVKQSQWELAYQVDVLRARLDATAQADRASTTGARGDKAPPPAAGDAGERPVAFVPLSSVRR